MGVLLWYGATAQSGTPVKCVVDGTPKGKRVAARVPCAHLAVNSLRWRRLRPVTPRRAARRVAQSCPPGHVAGSSIVSGRSHTATAGPLLLLDAMPPHDAQQARMVSKPQLLRRVRDVPLVPLERRDHDLTLGLGAPLEEGARGRRAGRRG